MSSRTSSRNAASTGRTRAQFRLERRRDRRTCCRSSTSRAAQGKDCVVIGQVHSQMPFMTGARESIAPERFDWLVEHERYDYELFCPPNPPIGTVDHAIGLHVSALVRDGGTLQVGIGELGDALVLRAAFFGISREQFTRRRCASIGTEHASAR